MCHRDYGRRVIAISPRNDLDCYDVVHPDEVDEFQIQKGMGCRVCNNTGYKGRIAVYEIMTMTEELREFVLNGASTLELKREAVRQGMKTLRMSALTKLREGMTSLDEVSRLTAGD